MLDGELVYSYEINRQNYNTIGSSWANQVDPTDLDDWTVIEYEDEEISDWILVNWANYYTMASLEKREEGVRANHTVTKWTMVAKHDWTEYWTWDDIKIDEDTSFEESNEVPKSCFWPHLEALVSWAIYSCQKEWWSPVQWFLLDDFGTAIRKWKEDIVKDRLKMLKGMIEDA